MSKKRDLGPCVNGCNHDSKHAVGQGPYGRSELCAHASHCLDVFLAVKTQRDARQSHCPPKCSAYVHYTEMVKE